MSRKSDLPSFWKSTTAWTVLHQIQSGWPSFSRGCPSMTEFKHSDYMRKRARCSFPCDLTPTHVLTQWGEPESHTQRILHFGPMQARSKWQCDKRVYRVTSPLLGLFSGLPGKDDRNNSREPQYFPTPSRQHHLKAVLRDPSSFWSRNIMTD